MPAVEMAVFFVRVTFGIIHSVIALSDNSLRRSSRSIPVI
jgi:hypothetical protein